MKGYRFFCLFAVVLCGAPIAISKKVRQKLKVETASKSSQKKDRKNSSDSLKRNDVCQRRVNADSISHISFSGDTSILFNPLLISFAGYDKQATSRIESFHILNNSNAILHKALLTIIYRDMKGRMLHKRDVTVNCNIPPQENRKIDIKTWDSQSSFYYYLSNPPRRVASPYSVEIIPKYFWISL